MSAEQMKAAAVKLIEIGLNQKDLSEFDRYFGATLVDHSLPPNLPPTLDGRKMNATIFLTAFPDLVVRAETLVVEGDKLAIHWSAAGTHRGDLLGIPPTGKSVSFGGIAVDRFAGGMVVEHWEEIDQFAVMQQLGLIPAA